MRKNLASRVTFITYALAAAAVGACGSESPELHAPSDVGTLGDPSGNDEGGTSAASGSGGGTLPTKITVTSPSGMPLAGTDVVSNDADGEVLEHVQTGSDGSVDVTVPAGGSVSVFDTNGIDYGVTTYIAPPPGKPINVTSWVTPASRPSTAITTYSVKPYGYPPATSSLHLRSTCDAKQEGEPAIFSDVTNEYCLGNSLQDFAVWAEDADGAMIAWGTLLDQPTNPGGELSYEVAVDQTAFVETTLVLTGQPTGASPDVSVRTLAHSVDFASRAYENKLYETEFTSMHRVPAVPGAEFEISLFTSWGTADARTRVGRVQRTGILPATISFDAKSAPWLSMMPLDATNPTRPVISWAVDKSTSQPDFVFAGTSWKIGTAHVYHYAYLPEQHATTFRIPAVPPELSSYAPSAVSAFEDSTVQYYDYEALDGFEDALVTIPYGGPYAFADSDNAAVVQ